MLIKNMVELLNERRPMREYGQLLRQLYLGLVYVYETESRLWAEHAARPVRG